ncbi:hypothetical protein P5673_010505 [Acropora cervicornis]|uniref:Uncharacterized protein n=1 Tax=Acropora cervicornis TaxID=6130 RepID=A0AAD9V8T0_ACRCE|nr:hypothetical protein P5673_010505 [Acropora cervicornis]
MEAFLISSFIQTRSGNGMDEGHLDSLHSLSKYIDTEDNVLPQEELDHNTTAYQCADMPNGIGHTKLLAINFNLRDFTVKK